MNTENEKKYLAFRKNLRNLFPNEKKVEFLGEKTLSDIICIYCENNFYFKDEEPNVVYDSTNDKIICNDIDEAFDGSFNFDDYEYTVFELENFMEDEVHGDYIQCLFDFILEHSQLVSFRTIEHFVQEFPGWVTDDEEIFVKFVKLIYPNVDIDDLDIEKMIDDYYKYGYQFTISLIYKNQTILAFKESYSRNSRKKNIEFLGFKDLIDIVKKLSENANYYVRDGVLYDSNGNEMCSDVNSPTGIIEAGDDLYSFHYFYELKGDSYEDELIAILNEINFYNNDKLVELLEVELFHIIIDNKDYKLKLLQAKYEGKTDKIDVDNIDWDKVDELYRERKQLILCYK